MQRPFSSLLAYNGCIARQQSAVSESGTAGHIAILIMDMAVGADDLYLEQTGPQRPPT